MGKRVAIQGWQSGLLRKIKPDGSTTNVLRPIPANATTILVNDDRWTDVLAYDAFAEAIVSRKLPPWRPCDVPHDAKPAEWSEEDTTRTQAWLADAWGLDLGAEAVLAAVRIVANRTVVHPIRDWLGSLRWDGTQRLPTWLVDVFGASDTPYTRACGTSWAISAVARAYQPGCKVDTVLVLEGKPAIRKSSILRALVGDEWFLELTIADLASKDAMQLLRRKWIAEIPEIDGMTRAEQATVKAYFSRQVDTYRPSYGRVARDFPRQTVFAASTNKDQYVSDETGGAGRRMWPVRCVRGDLALARRLRDQLWAEARARYESGQAWHIEDPELVDAEREEQDARYRPDPWEDPIAEWLAKPSDVGSKADNGVTISDVLESALHQDVAKRTPNDSQRVAAVLRRIGWVCGSQSTRNGARVRLYRPVDGAGTNGHTLHPISAPPPPAFDTDSSGEDLFPPKDLGTYEG